MIVIGLTGGLGTGKSTVARLLEKLGAVVFDADQVAHQVMEPKQLAWRKIVQAFGEGILNEDHTINRQQLAERVFQDPEARHTLEAIVHPQVIRRIKQQLHRLKRNRRACLPRRPGASRSRRRQVHVAVLDVPLLVETRTQELVDRLVVVTAPEDVAKARLQARGWSEDEMARRMAAQMSLSAKAALADVVVDNSDGLEQTRRQVRRLWDQLVGPTHKRHG